MKMKRTKYKFFTLTLFTIFILILSGCNESTGMKTSDENIKTIEAVLRNNLTGPDDELKEIINDMEGEEKLKALNNYDEKLYKDYFANNTSYQEYISSYGTVLWVQPINNNYKLEVKNIEFEMINDKENIYNFTLELQYQKENSESSEVVKVEGQANLNDDHKIESISYKTDVWENFS
ncbi:hypothetical protein [Pallidibacillus pasinlerensis]|uniref:Lipoprotein n=1 Tax=Pallidibacillus pasinlerensis TaxID=2703818 RepID=A0ABX0A6B3_9BACI|nr:hypothetical protein [Pallidibacillus pasinlerensis]NCU16733.1 hypothetical protein [Pallidibacillus pasinlerensis]